VSDDSDETLRVIRENAALFAYMVEADSVAVVQGEFSPVPEGHTAVHFKAGGIEGRYVVPKRSVLEEIGIVRRELEQLNDIVDNQLDLLDPDGASFQKKAWLWFHRKKGKKKEDAANPEQTIICADRILRQVELLQRLKQLIAEYEAQEGPLPP